MIGFVRIYSGFLVRQRVVYVIVHREIHREGEVGDETSMEGFPWGGNRTTPIGGTMGDVKMVEVREEGVGDVN